MIAMPLSRLANLVGGRVHGTDVDQSCLPERPRDAGRENGGDG